MDKGKSAESEGERGKSVRTRKMSPKSSEKKNVDAGENEKPKRSEGTEDISDLERPKLLESPVNTTKDPVKQQKKKNAVQKPKNIASKTDSITSSKIEPTLSKRIGLHYVNEGQYAGTGPRPKYELQRTKKQQEFFKKNRANTSKKFCKLRSVQVPKPIPAKKLEMNIEVPSPEASQAKVVPRRVTPTPSWLYPYPQTGDELELKKPKSGIIINVKDSEEKYTADDYDSFDLVFTRTPRPEDPQKQKGRRKRDRNDLEDIIEDDEETAERRQKKSRTKKAKGKTADKEKEKEEADENMEDLEEVMSKDIYGESDLAKLDDYLTKHFRKKVSQISQATSYQSKDIPVISEKDIAGEPAVSKYVQKFRRDSEIKKTLPKRKKIKRGTLESHSFTDINQPVLKDFFFGSKEGTMHQGDASFSPSVRNIQGLCMSVAAYCYSILKHPNRWTRENIDEILGFGNNLLVESAKEAHIHNLSRELKPQELKKYCTVGEQKIRFIIDDPDVTGYISSNDKRVYNLTKALKIFFARNSAGVFKTQDISIAIWKNKYFYMFDARPRTRDLYCSPTGTAIMANFYDIPALATVFLSRSNFSNWPFIIYPLKVFRILKKDDPEVNSENALDAISDYEVLNENKAVVLASFDLADKCFDFSRNKQSLAMSVLCLVYSRITPPNAWHRTTIDKIMTLGNKLYLECLQCESIVDLNLDSLPAFFTIGPYIVEIYIYGNVYADLLYRSCCCQLKISFEEFFEKCSNAILQINKCYLAVWKQRNMLYCFDPYSRNREGYRCRDGAACVSMHTNIDSLVDIIITNFDSKDMIFLLHAMKVCKIHRDPVQSSRIPKHISMDDYPMEEIKKYKMKKSKKAAVEKPVTVDYSALAMRRLLAGESPQNSIFEIGSTVGSLGMEQIPIMSHKVPSRSILEAHPKIVDVIADLESPSLSDTQIDPPLPQQPKIPAEIEFMELDSFELTMDEIELEEESYEEGYKKWGEGEEGEEDKLKKIAEGEGEEEYEYEGEGFEDTFFTANKQSQYSLKDEPSRISGEVNTDITYFPIKREILYPTYLRGKQEMKYRLQKYKFTDDDWENYLPPSPPEVTKSQELRKETNFVDLPDDTQIILGTKNVANFGKEVEFIAPFVCIMAGVVSKKYSILSWTEDIVDYILKCGNELYGTSKFRYDQVSTLEIPKLTLGTTSFRVLVQYIFDSYTRQNILELALNKILFVRSDIGVLVTPLYACAVFKKNHLYYMYDCFGNNEVGLSEGTSNEGTAYFARFKDLHSLTARIMFNKGRRERSEEVVYSRFVLSSVKIKEIRDWDKIMKSKKTAKGSVKTMDSQVGEDGDDKEDEEEVKRTQETQEETEAEEEDGRKSKKEKSKTAENEVGYKYRRGVYTIEGTKAISGRKVLSDVLKEDHFICICACLVLLSYPVKRWDTKKVDQVLKNGQHVYSHAEDLDISEKRTIKNILVGKNFFDIIVKMIKIENWKNNRTLNKGIDTLMGKKLSYFIVQFPNACYVVHKSQDELFHLFDPYGVQKSKKAGWVRCKNLKQLKSRLKKLIVSGGESYKFYNFEVTSIQKAPKEVLLSYRLQQYETEMVTRKEQLGKPFYEEVEWLEVDPIPWSRKVGYSAGGKNRGTVDNFWYNWDEEYPKDLYSLMGNIHQYCARFPDETRGKQTLANLVVAIGMMEIYELAEWNAAVVDSVLVNGDNYFAECIKDISDEDYEISIDDLKPDCSIFPFTFNVTFTPIVEGTMFLVRVTQFNLYKALRFFFNNVIRRCGIICCTRSERKRHVAFGKLQESEYFMFDSDCQGNPMFLAGWGVAYILRMTTLNRLLHVLTLTLRGGDFYIYDVEITGLKPIS